MDDIYTVSDDVDLEVQRVVERTVEILRTNHDLSESDAEELRIEMPKPHFTEFTFAGSDGSTIAVTITWKGVPYVDDKSRQKNLIGQMSQTNLQLRALV